MTQWTWVWVNSGSWWWMRVLACCSPWGRKESDMTEQLNCPPFSCESERLPPLSSNSSLFHSVSAAFKILYLRSLYPSKLTLLGWDRMGPIQIHGEKSSPDPWIRVYKLYSGKMYPPKLICLFCCFERRLWMVFTMATLFHLLLRPPGSRLSIRAWEGFWRESPWNYKVFLRLCHSGGSHPHLSLHSIHQIII